MGLDVSFASACRDVGLTPVLGNSDDANRFIGCLCGRCDPEGTIGGEMSKGSVSLFEDETPVGLLGVGSVVDRPEVLHYVRLCCRQ